MNTFLLLLKYFFGQYFVLYFKLFLIQVEKNFLTTLFKYTPLITYSTHTNNSFNPILFGGEGKNTPLLDFLIIYATNLTLIPIFLQILPENLSR